MPKLTKQEWLRIIDESTDYNDLYSQIVATFTRHLKIGEEWQVSAGIAHGDGYFEAAGIILYARVKLQELGSKGEIITEACYSEKQRERIAKDL